MSVVVGSHWLLVNIAIFPKGKMVLSVHYSRMYQADFGGAGTVLERLDARTLLEFCGVTDGTGGL